MHTTISTSGPILAVFPTGIGFGYSVHKDPKTFIDWGIKWTTSENKNNDCVRGFVRLLNLYKPTVLVLEEIAPDAHTRTAKLTDTLADIATSQGVTVCRYSRKQIQQAFEPDGTPTKKDIAEAVGALIPELQTFVPVARKIWETEHDAMSFFVAASLAITHFHFAGQK